MTYQSIQNEMLDFYDGMIDHRIKVLKEEIKTMELMLEGYNKELERLEGQKNKIQESRDSIAPTT